MAEKNKIRFTINGKTYTLLHDEPEEYMHRIEHYLNTQVAAASKSGIQLGEQTAIVMASISINGRAVQNTKKFQYPQERNQTHDGRIRQAEDRKAGAGRSACKSGAADRHAFKAAPSCAAYDFFSRSKSCRGTKQYKRKRQYLSPCESRYVQ